VSREKEFNRTQLIKFAEDLRKIYESEKEKRKSLEESKAQLEKYADDLRNTINELKISNKKLESQVEMEEREKMIQRQLIHANKMTSLGTMASGIAHEINNPVNFILSNSQLLVEIWDDLIPLLKKTSSLNPDLNVSMLSIEEVIKTVPKMLNGNIEGLRRIVKIINSIGKIGKGGEISTGGSMDVGRALHFSTTLLKKNIEAKTDSLQLNIPKKIPELRGDQGALEQVFINIIQNAIQSLPGKDACVIIDVEILKKSLRITVKDEGTGISGENLSKIFDPFFTTRTTSGGTGLGLYISYSIIKKLNGDLKISSVPGKGTKVEIIFPLS